MVHNSKVSFDLAAFFREAKFLVNVAQLANEGIIISWGKTAERPARLENRSNDATERNLLAWYHCSLSLLTFNVCVCNDLSLTTVTSNTSTTSPRWSPWDSRETKISKKSCGSSQACRAWGRSAWCLNSLNRVKTFVWKPIVRKTKVFRLCSFVVLCRHWLAPSFAAYSVCLAACQTEQSSVGLCVAACDTKYLLRAWDHFWVPAQGIGMDIDNWKGN